MDTSSTQVDVRQGNFRKILNVWLAISRDKHEGTHGSGEGSCLPCDSPVISFNREGAGQGSGPKIRVDGTEKKESYQAWCFSRTFWRLYWSVGTVPTSMKGIVLNKHKVLHFFFDSSTTARIKHWMKEFQQDVSDSSMVIESLKALNSGISTRRVSHCSILCSVDYINYVWLHNNVISDQK